MEKYKWLQLINLPPTTPAQESLAPTAPKPSVGRPTPPAHDLCSTESTTSHPERAAAMSRPLPATPEPGAPQDAQRRENMERAELELSLLNEISRILGSTLDLHAVFDQTMRVLADRLGMERGSMVLLDEPTGKLRTETAV